MPERPDPSNDLIFAPQNGQTAEEMPPEALRPESYKRWMFEQQADFRGGENGLGW